ncbi:MULTISPECIES: phage tail assembly protein [unclassified Sphingopyxis]|uniref:phage tail assembly protein n=1 Tax=unclassified Sphingopyxis TaxID=2614943 RepID=UPI0007304641|nr:MULTISPECIES: phage tail assembly protein [unclassified Sphingopyxis]KTE24464.1 hypothetical protein ATE61_13740 [Sphingopyxis sp. H057]KTE50992.1 hypothetical protein ATE69_17440 [Sphingopyxis sp. H071]KTE52135.1 hypothetical protein ATE64_12045 [Sphingopyxis sp. H073]KTE60532.1 hypothetical protein ATE66_08100 [Sphingopyxis sp. H107]KTE63879.1 hypothetical protein ATE65_13835 [Sphingopyxis sp. H100]
MPDTYILKHPITEKGTGAVIIGEVVVRRPKGKDMKAADKAESDFHGSMVLIDRLCSLPGGGDVPANFSDELDVEDLDALGELVTAMLPGGRKTGATT